MVRDNMLDFKWILCLRIHVVAVIRSYTGPLLNIARDASKHILDVFLGKAVQTQLRKGCCRIICEVVRLGFQTSLQHINRTATNILCYVKHVILDSAIVYRPIIRYSGSDQQINESSDQIHLFNDNRPRILITNRSQKQLRLKRKINLCIVIDILCFLCKCVLSFTDFPVNIRKFRKLHNKELKIICCG